MKIAFFEIEEWEKDYLTKKLKKHKLVFSSEVLSEKNVASFSDCDIVSVFIYSKLNKKVIDSFKKLNSVVTRSTGFDHVEIDYCKKKGIKVFNVPSYGENTVAEHTFALILALTRKIHKSYERTVRGDFSLDGLRGVDLKGKTIGIVGLGKIGKNVAIISKGFNMNILAYDRFPDKKFEKQVGLKFVSLDNLLKNSDIVTFHCPYNKETHHTLNKKNIKLLKKDSFVINTSRGGIIDTEALLSLLSEKKIAGAGLDVLEEESMIREERQLLSKDFPKEELKNLLENHVLLTFDNVLITPHNAFNSIESLERIMDVTVENIDSIANKKSSLNLIK